MTLAWQSEIASGPKMVLLSLCDNANENGECYPSIALIAKRCSMSERSVQGHLNALEKQGCLTRKSRQSSSTLYTIDPRRICTPQNLHPRLNHKHHPSPQNLRPRRICTPSPQNLHPSPQNLHPPSPQNLHPESSMNRHLTVKEPSSRVALKSRRPFSRLTMLTRRSGKTS